MSVLNGGLPHEQNSTIFSTLPGNFPNAQNKIKTNEFLEASSGVVLLIEEFGTIFKPVIHDMNGNINKIRTKYEENQELYDYLEDMILENRRNNQLIAVDALQWLRRGLHLVAEFFNAIIEDSDSNVKSQDLSPFMKVAYSQTLERYHGWLGVQLFNILTRFTPKRSDLLYVFALKRDNREDHVIRDMREFTRRMNDCIQKLVKFYEENNLETHNKV